MAKQQLTTDRARQIRIGVCLALGRKIPDGKATRLVWLAYCEVWERSERRERQRAGAW
jgi:hypothetical protein